MLSNDKPEPAMTADLAEFVGDAEAAAFTRWLFGTLAVPPARAPARAGVPQSSRALQQALHSALQSGGSGAAARATPQTARAAPSKRKGTQDADGARPRRAIRAGGDAQGIRVTVTNDLAAAAAPAALCAFYPRCRAGDTCPFLHPMRASAPVTQCKFGQHCKNPTCAYAHASPAQGKARPGCTCGHIRTAA